MIRLLLLFALVLAAWPAEAQLAPGEKAMKVSLAAETERPAAGSTVTLAVVMSPRKGWHGYWENPGDAGVGTRVDWKLPAGVAAGPLRYPVPERLVIQGLMNYVFEGEHALLLALSVPKGLARGTPLPLRGRIDYLVCTDKICVPESAPLALDLAVGDGGGGEARLDRFREALPKPLGAPARFELHGARLRIGIPLPAAVDVPDPYFYPLTQNALVYSAPQRVSRNGDWLVIETEAGTARARAVEGVLGIGEGQGLSLAAAPGDVPAAGTPITTEAGGGGRAADVGTVLAALAGALLGGLLLNVMPCVFPILSLKALSLARAAGEEREARREALAYAAGAVLACLALGGALLAIRSGGAAVGWAFQLQDPRVILLLLLLVTAIALNLAGWFELPSLAVSQRGGAFWTGALAAFVATPCTGPFMGAALGAAIVLPNAAALAVFAGLGLGLALPFLLLGFVPALRRRLPRPGPWMGRLRRILSIPMFLTAAGLAWILVRQVGAEGFAVGLAAAATMAAALWWARRRHGWLPLVPAAAAAALALAFLPNATAPAEARGGAVAGAEPFSEARLAALRAQGRPVFLYFTADWCITCKVNEKAVLARGDVAEALKEKQAAVLVGDWTRGDAAIGRFLERHGRSGVPLYLWYPRKGEAEVLPQILTPGRVTGLST